MEKTKIRIGIIGCGAIGTDIAKACENRLKDSIALGAISDIDGKKADLLNELLKKKAPVLSIDALIKQSDIVIESASAKVSADIVGKCIKARKPCLVMSVGGLLGKEHLLKLAEDRGVKIYIPSGAICGIDGLKSASVGKIDSVTLTTRKPLKGLEGAPYLKEKNIDITKIKIETVIFEGSAEEAVKGFPQNVNVSAVLSLAGVGSTRTRVRIVTSPEYTRNIHEIKITGDCGEMTTRTENVPSVTNPKTSALAIFAAIATLEGISRSVRIGT